MWKLIVAFIAFAALALFILAKSGGDIDLSGEKHDVAAGGHEPSPAASAAVTAAAEAVTGEASAPAAAAASAASQ